MIGVENRPNSVFHCNRWLSDKKINFKTQSPESVPSRLFYCFIGKATDVAESLWPYLQNTKIHTLDLSLNQIGAEALAKALPGTKIHTLILDRNKISDQGTGTLAGALPDTKIERLNLKYNRIGAESLAKVLSGTNMQTLRR